jgi:predicted RND superfamily exporter protein
LPFFLIGIGVDDAFIIVNAIDQTDPDDDMEERIGQALSHSGVSVRVLSCKKSCSKTS